MTEIVLHFPVDSAPDPEALAQALQERCESLEHVESAEVASDRVAVVDDIVLVLTVSTMLLGSGTVALTALKKFIDTAKEVGQSLGIHSLSVEGNGRVVDSGALTEADAKAIADTAS